VVRGADKPGTDPTNRFFKGRNPTPNEMPRHIGAAYPDRPLEFTSLGGSENSLPTTGLKKTGKKKRKTGPAEKIRQIKRMLKGNLISKNSGRVGS
jgi:hypothetical protein